jgi:hypothetical protein
VSPHNIPYAANSIASGLERLVVTLACNRFEIHQATLECVRREIAHNLDEVAAALPLGTQWRNDAELLMRAVIEREDLSATAQAARDWADLIWIDTKTGVRA